MKRRENWEDKIKDVLTFQCDGLTPSQDLKDRIDEKILTSQEAESMKHLSAKKLIIGIAVGCLLISKLLLLLFHAAVTCTAISPIRM